MKMNKSNMINKEGILTFVLHPKEILEFFQMRYTKMFRFMDSPLPKDYEIKHYEWDDKREVLKIDIYSKEYHDIPKSEFWDVPSVEVLKWDEKEFENERKVETET